MLHNNDIPQHKSLTAMISYHKFDVDDVCKKTPNWLLLANMILVLISFPSLQPGESPPAGQLKECSF